MILTGEKESFIVRVLLKKIKDAGVECAFVPFDVNRINPALNDNTSLVVLFMEDGYQPPKDVLHYVKDQLEEKDIRYFANNADLPVIESECPANRHTEREEMKDLLRRLERENKGLRHRIFGAMQRANVDGYVESSLKEYKIDGE